jgi:multidrug efflux pump subunit AcrA (membrane-fusion protein)
VANPGHQLRPGMMATVTFEGERLDNVTRIPNAALTFRPSRQVLQTIGEVDEWMVAHPGQEDEPGRDAEVWEFDGDLFHPVPIRVGFGGSDGTQLVRGSIQAGDALVTSAVVRKHSGGPTP